MIALPKKINNDLALFFDSANSQQMNIPTDGRYNFGTSDFFFGFTCEVKTNGIIFEINDGGLTILIDYTSTYVSVDVEGTVFPVSPTNPVLLRSTDVVDDWIFHRSGASFYVYRNGALFNEFAINGGDAFDLSSTTLRIATRQNETSHEDCLFQHVFFGDGNISEDEALLKSRYSGFIPVSLHYKILNHWPLTQKYYYNDGGTLKAWDVAYQYNNSKNFVGDLITNGDFSTNDLTGWSNPLGTVDASSGEAVWQSGSTVQLQQIQWNNAIGNVVKVIVKYEITQEITGSGATFRYNGLGGEISPSAQSVGSYTYEFFTDGDVRTVFQFINATGGAVDNLSVEVVSLPAIHAELINFTNSDVGADEIANQNSIYSTKSKQIANNWGLKFNGSDQYAQQDPLTNNIVTTNRDNLTLYARFDEINNTGDTDISVLFRNGTSVALAINVNRNTNLITLQVELDGQTGNANFVNSDWDRPLVMIFEKTDEDPNNWGLNLNGVKITPNSASGTHGTTSTEFTFTQLTLGGGFSGAGNFDFDGILNDSALWDRILTIEERTDLYLKEILPSSGLLERANPEKRSDSQINTFAGNTLTLQNFTLSEFDSYYREKKSGLPEMKNAIDMNDVSRSIDIPSLQFESIELIVMCSTDIADLDDLITFGSAVTINEYRFNGVVVADEAALVNAINDNSICQVSLKVDQITTTATINNFDGYIIHYSLNWYSDEEKNGPRSLLENFNNSLLKSTRGLRTNFYTFNSENDGIDYIGGSDATLNNITATEIIDINTLR